LILRVVRWCPQLRISYLDLEHMLVGGDIVEDHINFCHGI